MVDGNRDVIFIQYENEERFIVYETNAIRPAEILNPFQIYHSEVDKYLEERGYDLRMFVTSTYEGLTTRFNACYAMEIISIPTVTLKPHSSFNARNGREETAHIQTVDYKSYSCYMRINHPRHQDVEVSRYNTALANRLGAAHEYIGTQEDLVYG